MLDFREIVRLWMNLASNAGNSLDLSYCSADGTVGTDGSDIIGDTRQ